MDRRTVLRLLGSTVIGRPLMGRLQPAAAPVDRVAILAAMKKATTFMVEKVAYKGGYVWSYLPDLSRRWAKWKPVPR